MSSDLVGAVDRLLRQGQDLVRRSSKPHRQGVVRLVPDERALIDALLLDPAADGVRSALAALGAPDDEHLRPMDEDALRFSGVAHALAQETDLDVSECASDFARYLTGPRRVEDWVALAGEVPAERCRVAGGWEFGRFREEELWSVLPIPSVARVLNRRDPFRPDVWSQIAFLRRPSDAIAPTPGALVFNFGPDSEMDDLWAPLLALAMWSNHPIGVGGRWTIDLGCAYREERRASLEFVPPSWCEDEDEDEDEDEVILADWERLYRVEDHDWKWFAAFQQEIAERVDSQPAGHRRRRLEYAARHFLAATSLGSGPGADVWQEEAAVYPERTLEALFRYCSALEASVGDGGGELTRKVSQRAALVSALVSDARLPMFAGEIDHPYTTPMPDILRAADIVKQAYNGRSSFAHGDKPPTNLWNKARIPELRMIVRATLLGGLILDRASATDALPDRYDDALISADSRQTLAVSIASFVKDVEARASATST